MFIDLKKYNANCKLVYPSEFFVEFSRKLEENFVSTFDAVYHNEKVLQRLVLVIERNINTCDYVCSQSCVPAVMYAIKLYVKVRLCHVLKLQNDAFCQVKMKRNRKLLTLSHL